MFDINVEVTETAIITSTPYTPEFPRSARALGGKWDGTTKTWSFDRRDADRVYALLSEVYGWTPAPTGEVVTVRGTLSFDALSWDRELRLAGRRIAYRPSRDEDVALADGVVILEGAFPYRGGSRANPAIFDSTEDKPVVIEVRDVPAEAVASLDGGKIAWEVVSAETLDREALMAEREQLLARLAEIEKILG